MTRKSETIKHYKEMTNEICVADLVWCRAHYRRQARAIYSSVRMIFEGHKDRIDEYYIKEKLAIAKDADDIQIIKDEIAQRIKDGRMTRDDFELFEKIEISKWPGLFDFII